MFVKTKYSGYRNDGSQSAGGLFLILMQKESDGIRRLKHGDLRAVVRHVRMTQFGHFMMGTVQVGPKRLTLSGSYGSDGLPITVSDEVWERGIPLPDELYDAWSTGGGWNSAGSEAQAMRQWALENLKELRNRKGTNA